VASQRERDILGDREGVEERGRLEDHTDAHPDAVHRLIIHRVHRFAKDEDLAPARLEQPNQVLEEHALAAAARTHDDLDLALPDPERHTFQDRDPIERLPEVMHGHDVGGRRAPGLRDTWRGGGSLGHGVIRPQKNIRFTK
jgi:hypothetical protein